MIEGFVLLLVAYADVGALFAVLFVSFGVQRLDAASSGAGIAFRLLIWPGVAALWPMFLLRWMRNAV
jgi:hypothetical protein